MRSWRSSPKLIKVALVAILCGSGCTCDSERSTAKSEAKSRVGARVEASPTKIAAAENLDASELHTDRKQLDRVWRMPWREVKLRLATHQVWQGRAELSYGNADGPKLGLDEEAEIRFQQGTDSLDVSVSNDGGFFQRVVYSNGRLFRKYQNGNYITSKDLDSKRLHHADEAFALGATGWDLLGRLIALKPIADAQIAGRKCHCYELRKAAAPAAFDNSSFKGILKDLKSWRAGLTIETLEGSLCVDSQTSVPLRIKMKAQAVRQLKAGQGALQLSLLTEFSTLGKAPAISAPEEFLDTLRRKRRDRPGTTFLKDKGIKVLERPDAGTEQSN
jgi:hypothetical protein